MKRLIVTLACLVIMGGIMAQEHLSFKGVPVKGTLKEFTAAMEKAGFKSEGTNDDGITLLSGDFEGYKGCMMGVSTLSDSDLVNSVAVIFPERNTWASLLSDYEQLKSMLTKKYGEPTMDMEYFTGSVTENDSDALKMSALDKDEIMWFTIYSSNLGNIELSIVSSSPGEGVVRMMYSDLNIIESMK